MLSSQSHQDQELLVPQAEEQGSFPSHEAPPLGEDGSSAGVEPTATDFHPEKMTQGPVNAITVLTLLDKLVNMLDTVQENQHKMEGRQVEMEGVVMGIQADMTKLSKNHSHTANTVSKLLDKSRKVSVTMKEVRDKMERQAVQVKRLEANHTHLLNRNNFKVLIFQEHNEIPSSVFVHDAVPFPRDGGEEGGDNRSQEEELHSIHLSSDEDVGLEAEYDEEVEELHDLDNMEKSRAEKIKRSSLKKVDSLKKAFSRQNIEKKMTKIGTKIVSQEQRDKIKKSLAANQPRASFKVAPLSFSMRKSKGSSDSQPVEVSVAEPQAPPQTGDSLVGEADVELAPLGSPDLELPFTEVHTQLAPPVGGEEQGGGDGEASHQPEADWEEQEEPGPGAEEFPQSFAVEADLSALSEGVSDEYALSATLRQEERSLDGGWEEVQQEELREEEEEEEDEKEGEVKKWVLEEE